MHLDICFMDGVSPISAKKRDAVAARTKNALRLLWADDFQLRVRSVGAAAGC
jgi:hypothetical protein